MIVAQSCLTLCNPMEYSLPVSLVHGILQARILEWVAVSWDLPLCTLEKSGYLIRWEQMAPPGRVGPQPGILTPPPPWAGAFMPSNLSCLSTRWPLAFAGLPTLQKFLLRDVLPSGAEQRSPGPKKEN